MEFFGYRKYYFYLHGYQLPCVVNFDEGVDYAGESQEVAHLICGFGRVLQVAQLESFQGIGVCEPRAPDIV